MNKQRLYYYFLYGLLLGGIAGKLIGWISLTHGIFFDWVTEGMVLLFLLLEGKSLFRYLNPGIRMLDAMRGDGLIFQTAGKAGWLAVGILIRILGIGFLSLMAFLFLTEFRNTEYIFAAICGYFAMQLLAGIVLYLRQNPYYFLIDEEGVKNYFFSYKQLKWEEMDFIGLKPQWLALQPRQKAVNIIEFENLEGEFGGLIESLQSQASARNIPFKDQRLEFGPEAGAE